MSGLNWKTLLGVSLIVSTASACSTDSTVASCSDAPGSVCVWAGTGALGYNGDGHDKLESRLYWPTDLTFGSDGKAWVLDWNNHMIRTIDEAGVVETHVGDQFVGDGPPDQSDLHDPGAHGHDVALNHPTDLQFGHDGKLYFAAWHNHKIRSYDPQTRLVHVMCGRGAGYAGDGGPAADALFSQPKSLEIDSSGAMYILDQRNFRIRKIEGGTDATIHTVVGNGTAGFSGDEGPPTEAQLKFDTGGNPEPSGALALASDRILYISDGLNYRIRRVDFEANTITTIAGTGEAGDAGDGGPAIDAQLNNVKDLELGPDGRLYLADTDNHRIRAIDLETGEIENVVGSGERGSTIDPSSAEATELSQPYGIAFDDDGALYVADTYNSRILKVTR